MESNEVTIGLETYVSRPEIDSDKPCIGCAAGYAGSPLCVSLDECYGVIWVRKEAAVAEYVATVSLDTDLVNQPAHYTLGEIECIDYIKDTLTPEEFRGYLRGCMIKYQHRLMHKGSPQMNAEKIAWYADKLIREL